MLLFHQLFKKLAEGYDKHSHKEIANSVNEIKRNTRHNPRKSLLEAEPEHQGLCRSIQYSECKPVKTADGRINSMCSKVTVSR